MAAISSVQNLNTAMTSAVRGASEASSKVSKAADNMVKSYAANANEVASSVEGTKLDSETFLSTVQEDIPADPTGSTVEMMQQKRVYEANLEVMRVADEMQETMLDIMT